MAARANRVIYLMDGNIHDELILETYRVDGKKKSFHEKRLSEWLDKQGLQYLVPWVVRIIVGNCVPTNVINLNCQHM